jgi:hypothetical protein
MLSAIYDREGRVSRRAGRARSSSLKWTSASGSIGRVSAISNLRFRAIARCGGAKAKALRIVCVNNLKQIAVSIHLYAGDNEARKRNRRKKRNRPNPPKNHSPKVRPARHAREGK